jgi:hypothetical protein
MTLVVSTELAMTDVVVQLIDTVYTGKYQDFKKKAATTMLK